MGLTDKLKDAVSGSGGHSGASTGATGGGPGAAGGSGAGGAAGGAGQKDYGDKAFDFISKKSGHNIDDKTSEKITDGARGVYEKTTGQKVNPKFSN